MIATKTRRSRAEASCETDLDIKPASPEPTRDRSDRVNGTEWDNAAVSSESDGAETPKELLPNWSTSQASSDLQALQHERCAVMKSKAMQSNRLQSVIAGGLGYGPNLSEKERAKKFVEASAVIKAVAAGGEHPMAAFIRASLVGIDSFDALKAALEKKMLAISKTLPVAEWVKAKPQRGFGLLFLAIVVGECGDLANFSNPAKIWKRMGCAPHQFAGKTLMGATWKSGQQGKLPAEEWLKFGYCPRRRSIAYLIGENIVRQNQTGPFRARYLEAKAAAKLSHPDWSDLRAHRHGMLLATKRLLREIWIQWNGAKENSRPAERAAEPYHATENDVGTHVREVA